MTPLGVSGGLGMGGTQTPPRPTPTGMHHDILSLLPLHLSYPMHSYVHTYIHSYFSTFLILFLILISFRFHSHSLFPWYPILPPLSLFPSYPTLGIGMGMGMGMGSGGLGQGPGIGFGSNTSSGLGLSLSGIGTGTGTGGFGRGGTAQSAGAYSLKYVPTHIY